MAIRKDLSDMLNSLKNNSEPEHSAQRQQHRSVYDDMSLDDLLTTIDSRPSVAEEVANELALEEAMNTAADVPEKAAEDAVPAPPPAEPEPAPLPKSKRIVISAELPDYEAIRQQELEKMRLESQRAAAEKAAALTPPADTFIPYHAPGNTSPEFAPPVVPLAPVDTAADEIPMPEEEQLTAVPEETPVPVLIPEEDIEKIPETEEKSKGGFFSKFRRKAAEELKAAEDEIPPEEKDDDTADEEEDTLESFSDDIPEAAADIPEYAYEAAESDTLYADADEQDEGYTTDEPETETSETEHQPTADELLDAAIAAIKGETMAAAADEGSSDDIPENEDAEDDEEQSEEEFTEAEEEDSDAVGSLIDGIREDAANAIADIEKPRTEEPAEQPEKPAKETEEAVSPEPETAEPAEKVSTFRAILDEDPASIIEERHEHTESDVKARKEKKPRKRIHTILGVVFSVFAVIGIITVAFKGVKLFRSFTSGEVKKDGFSDIIYPAVIMDIESFNSPSELSSDQMITAAIWSIIMDEDRISKYNVNPGTDTVSIPYMDVEARAVEMFGTDHQPFEHVTVGPVNAKFYYSDGAYNVQLKPIIFTYSPEIKSVTKNNNEYTVSVDYIDELPSWMEKTVSKSVEFKLTERSDGTYCIKSMNIVYVKGNIQ